MSHGASSNRPALPLPGTLLGHRRSSTLICAAAVLAFAHVAEAQPKGTSAKPSGDVEAKDAKKEEAKTRFERAMGLLDKQVWDAALAEFLESRAAYPTRGNTQNAAICLRRLNRFDEALAMFETLVKEFPNLTPQDKQLVDREIGELVFLVGTLEVRGDEPDAQVAIDGRDRGMTPLAATRVSAGSHVVRVYKEGFRPFEKRVEVAGRQGIVVNAKFEALTQSGRLSVTEDGGRKADVLVDNVVVGKTPWQGQVGVGEHVVFLRGESNLGTQPASAATRINQVTRIVLALEPLDSALRVEPSPAGATIAIDGVSVANGLWDGRLRKGRHKLEVAQLGFVPSVREIDLGTGKSERLPVQLERDPDSPLWRIDHPPRIFAELAPVFPIGVAVGGDVSSSCSGACSASLPVGAAGRFRGGYELRSGLGFGLDVGYMYLTQNMTDRSALVRPVGRPDASGTASDRLSLRGLIIGASAHLHRGEKLPLTFRVGVGALLGTAGDSRAGTFGTPTGPVTVERTRTDADAAYLYVAPEVRLAYPIAKRVEVSIGADVMLMVALKEPRWESANAVVVGGQGLGTYENQTMFGSTLVLVNPGVGARFDF